MSDRNNSSVKNLIFDFGNVLVDWNPRYLYRKIFKTEKEVESFLRDVEFSHWIERTDAGEKFGEIFKEAAAKHPKLIAYLNLFYERFPETISGEISESVKILEELKKKNVPIFGLTNWSTETFYRIRPDYPFFSWFLDTLVSGEEGVIKPSVEIYERAIQRFKIKPEETLFIDDKLPNVEGAKKAGLQGYQFINPEELREELVSRGLL